jgi:hypothetical protein
MDYELAKQLKDAGFPQKEFSFAYPFSGKWPGDIAPVKYPYNAPLEELIQACEDKIVGLQQAPDKTWVAFGKMGEVNGQQGSTPTEAVARLWLALHTI